MPVALTLANVRALCETRADGVFWIDGDGAHTWADFGRLFEKCCAELRSGNVAAGEIIVLPGDYTFEAAGWFLATAAVGAVAVPIRSERRSGLLQIRRALGEGREIDAEGLASWRTAPFNPRWLELRAQLLERRAAGLILFTGGTTGEPKFVVQDLSALAARHQIADKKTALRLMPLMHFDHIGGLDIFLDAVARGQCLVPPPPERAPEEVAEILAKERVEALAATPTFLNLLLLSGALLRREFPALQVIAYGAEPMPEALLARLKNTFPAVRFVQRYGTTETGTLRTATAENGRLRFLDEGKAWKIVDGELWVRSASQALGYLGGAALDAEGWFRTGDFVERAEDGSLRVLGRREEMINVGGQKVFPSDVESVLLGHPEVADCRVYAEANAITGQVVVVDIVWREAGATPLAVKRALGSFCVGRLSAYQVPSRVRLVGAVDTTANLKKLRRPLT